MNNKQLSEIADATQTSKATVSKVLNHCYGVGNDVRERVFLEKERITRDISQKRHVPIYVIMPEAPDFFWNCNLLQCPGYEVKYNIYSKLGDTAMVMRYLKEAVMVEAKVIVIVAQIDDEIKSILEEIADRKLIIFLTELNHVINTFYVGSNPIEDGKRLAELCNHSLCTEDRILLVKDVLPCQSETSTARLNSFLQEINPEIKYDMLEVEYRINVSWYSATLARELSPFLEKYPYKNIVCFNGFTHHLCSALQKIKKSYQIKCYGFEKSPRSMEYVNMGYLKAVVCQNFTKQLEIAIGVAEKYLETGTCPSSKYVYVKSEMIEYL